MSGSSTAKSKSPYLCIQVSPAPQCLSCEVERRLVYDEPATVIYTMRFYRCPVCRTTVRFVERKSPQSSPIAKAKPLRRNEAPYPLLNSPG